MIDYYHMFYKNTYFLAGVRSVQVMSIDADVFDVVCNCWFLYLDFRHLGQRGTVRSKIRRRSPGKSFNF